MAQVLGEREEASSLGKGVYADADYGGRCEPNHAAINCEIDEIGGAKGKRRRCEQAWTRLGSRSRVRRSNSDSETLTGRGRELGKRDETDSSLLSLPMT